MLKLYFKKILSKAWRKFIKIKNYVTTENDSLVKSLYQSATNPIFEVFYLENPHGVIADFSGNPPYQF